MTNDPFNPTVRSIAAHHAAASAEQLCEMGKQTLFEDGEYTTCEEPLPQPAVYAVIVGEQESRALCSICTDKAVTAGIGMGESVQAYRLDEGL